MIAGADSAELHTEGPLLFLLAGHMPPDQRTSHCRRNFEPADTGSDLTVATQRVILLRRIFGGGKMNWIHDVLAAKVARRRLAPSTEDSMKARHGKVALLVVALTMGALRTWVLSAQGLAPRSKAPQLEWIQEIFVDYGSPSHAGPGPHPTTESSDFHVTMGGIRWFAGDTVKYEITGTAPSEFNNAIEAAEATWDTFITTREFVRDDTSPTANPCWGNNRIVWAPIDGPGSILSVTSVCRNVVTKEIVGFVIVMDSGEAWTTSGEAGKFDVENVASHEFGHVAGLGHVNAPRAGCLSMYFLSIEGETQKRTLGLGDKLGMNLLYTTGDTSPSPGCGL
jgi:hypothetical protein